MTDLLDKWKNLVNTLNEKGIPIPTARDPKTKVGSVSFTMLAVSFGLMSLCTGMSIGLIVSKWAGFFTDNADALMSLKEGFFMAFQMSGLSAGLYWGRRLTVSKSGTVELDK